MFFTEIRKEKKKMKRRKFIALAVALLLVLCCVFALGACGDNDSDDVATDEGDATADTDLPTKEAGKLIVATGDPAWPPWVLNDDPESGEGYEAAIVYAVAEQLGFSKDQVEWVRSGFDEAINPGPKDYDFNIQQYSITDERKQAVDFSSPYYKETLCVIAKKGNDFADATSIADLQGALFGAAQGDIAVEFTKETFSPDKEPMIYDDLSAVFAALDSGQIDACVTGLLTANFVVEVEPTFDTPQVENGVVVGQIEGSDEVTDGLGLLLEKDSPLTPYVSNAIDELWANGTIDNLINQWLGDYSYPMLS